MFRLSVFKPSRGHTGAHGGNGLLADPHPQPYWGSGSVVAIASLAQGMGVVAISVVNMRRWGRTATTSAGIDTAAHRGACVVVRLIWVCVQGRVVGGIYGSQWHGGFPE